MSNKRRIDLEYITLLVDNITETARKKSDWGYDEIPGRSVKALIDKINILMPELKRMYNREFELMEILSILEDRHDIDMSQFDASE